MKTKSSKRMTLSVLVLTVWAVTNLVDAQCPMDCLCTNDVIDCSGLGLREITNVTRPLTVNSLSRLDFSNNRIRLLDIDELFDSLQGLSIEVIDFSNNVISDVNGTFDALNGKDYTVLNLSNNALRIFPSSVIPINHHAVSFTLDVSNNMLTELTENMFAGGRDSILPGFTFIASNNLISDIHPNTFQGINLLQAVVDLRFNRIRFLAETFQPPREVLRFRLSDNPWRCDCNLRWIVSPSNNLVNIIENEPLTCQTPLALQGRLILGLNADEFACLPFQNGPLQRDFFNTDTFVVTCPLTADPVGSLRITWQVWIPSAGNGDPVQLFFDSETVGLRDLNLPGPMAAFKCTGSNNAGSLTLSLDVRYENTAGIPVPECPMAIAPEEC